MREVLWARHGQNEANLSRTLSHRGYDRDLTDLGRRQARQLAEELAERVTRREARQSAPVLAIAASPLRRARQTAAIVADRLGLPIAAELEDLREVDVGALDGRADEAAWAVYHRVLTAWSVGELAAAFPGGEDGHALVARLRRGLRSAAALADAGTSPPPGFAASAPPGFAASAPPPGVTTSARPGVVLVVAHGANLRIAVPALTGARYPPADLPTGGYARLDVEPGPQGRIRLLDWPEAAGR